MNIENLIAKSDGTTLLSHTKMVVNFTNILCENANLDDELKRVCRTAAVLHDIGKCSDAAQKALLQNSTPCPHCTLSWAFASAYLDTNNSDRHYRGMISDAIAFHHCFIDDKNDDIKKDIDTILSENEDSENIMRAFYAYFKDTENIFPLTGEPHDLYSSIDKNCTFFKKGRYDKTIPEWKTIDNASVVKAVLICADRLASDNSIDKSRVENNDVEYIRSLIVANNNITSIEGFNFDEIFKNVYDNERLKGQIDITNKAIDNLSSEKYVSVVTAGAGYGKTLIGLYSILKRGKKTFWLVPKKTIASSTFKSICNELTKTNCPMSACLVYGGKIQDKFRINGTDNDTFNDIDNFDVVVAVIDSIISRYFKNNTINRLYNLLTRDIIFDEYHEMVTSEPLFALFSLLIRTRAVYTNAYSLLLSATPMSLERIGIFEFADYLKNNNDNGRYLIHSDVSVHCHVINENGLIGNIQPNSFVLTNTVQQAQTIYQCLKENGFNNLLLLHSGFIDDDRNPKMDTLFENFGKNTEESNMIVVATGSLIGTGVDVSAKHIYDFVTTPADTIQRICGRASRFGEYDSVDYFIVKAENPKAENIVINEVYSTKLRNKFIDFIEKEWNDKSFSKAQLYDEVDRFNQANAKEINVFYRTTLEKSEENLSNISLRMTYAFGDDNEDTTYLSKKQGLRSSGNQFFIAIPYENSSVKSAVLTIEETILREKLRKDNKNNIENSYHSNKNRYKYYSDYCSSTDTDKRVKGIFGVSKLNNNSFTFDNCKKIAYCSNTPLLLSKDTAYYDKELGLVWR